MTAFLEPEQYMREIAQRLVQIDYVPQQLKAKQSQTLRLFEEHKALHRKQLYELRAFHRKNIRQIRVDPRSSWAEQQLLYERHLAELHELQQRHETFYCSVFALLDTLANVWREQRSALSKLMISQKEKVARLMSSQKEHVAAAASLWNFGGDLSVSATPVSGTATTSTSSASE